MLPVTEEANANSDNFLDDDYEWTRGEKRSPKQTPQRAARDQHRVSVVAAHSHDDDLESFYLDKGNAQSGQRLLSPTGFLWALVLLTYHREKIRSIRGVLSVAPMTWFARIPSGRPAGELFRTPRSRRRS